MTLYDQDAINFYIEGAQRSTNYQVVPMNISKLADELGSIYTYSYEVNGQSLECVIGKVRGA